MSRQAAPPPQIDGFEAVEQLGGGGFADVWLYRQQLPRREVAVKVLLRGLGGSAQQAFEAEANLMAHLSSHPAIVSIFQAGVARDGRPFIVMERCKPEHLGARARRSPLQVAEALQIGVQVAGAVETAHRAGIIHRDIKPANILLTAYDNPALTDFGISVSTDTTPGAEAGVSVPWAPPEQIQPVAGAQIGPTADVYALAATVYTLLAGRSPFELTGRGLTIQQLVQRVLSVPVPPIGRQDVPAALERVLATAMAKQPGQRYPTALEFARALQQVQTELSLPVTRIEVLDDSLPNEIVEEDGGATRIGNIAVIDPDVPSTGGREFTSPGVGSLDTVRPAQQPQHLLPPSPVAPPQDEAPAPAKPVGRMALIAGGLVVLLVAGVAGVNLLTGDGTGGRTAAADTPTAAAAPVDPVGTAPPAPESVTGQDGGAQVQFTWTNPDPQSGDRYDYRWTEVGASGEFATTDSPAAELPRRAGQTCIEVILIRSDGQYSEPATGCVATP